MMFVHTYIHFLLIKIHSTIDIYHRPHLYILSDLQLHSMWTNRQRRERTRASGVILRPLVYSPSTAVGTTAQAPV